MNAIAPGEVETEGAHSGGIIGSDFEKAMIARTPLGRTGQPDDIARVAIFLASNDSAWLTGSRQRAATDNIARYCVVPLQCRLTSSTTSGPEWNALRTDKLCSRRGI